MAAQAEVRFAAGVRLLSLPQGGTISCTRGHFAIDETSRAALWRALPSWAGSEPQLPCGDPTMIDALVGVGVLEACAALSPVPLPAPAPVVVRGSVALTALLERAMGDAAPLDPASSRRVLAVACDGADREATADISRHWYGAGEAHWIYAQLAHEVSVMARLVPDETLCFDCLCRRLDIPATTTAVPDAALGLPALARNLWLESVYPQLATHASIVVTRNGVSTPHVALAVPECVACRQSLKHASPRILPLRDVYVPDEAAPLADAETGVLREVAVYHPADDQQPSFPSCASARLLLPLPDGGSATIRGEGKGVTAADAVHGAIGEGIERYAASLWPADRLRRAVFRPEHAFDPRWLVLYEEEQYAQPGFPFARFDPDARLSWTWGRWLDDDSLVWVPALATWLDFPVAASERFAQVTSSGLATGSSYEDAALRAVYELIERDAFMRFWMSRTHPVRLLDVDIDEPVRRALHAIERQGAQVEVHVLEDASGHATVLCAGYGDGQRWPGLTVGLGTHASLTVAVRKAVLEHSHYGLYMQRLMREGRHHAVREAADVRSNLDHGLWYVDPARQIAMRARTRHAAAESMIHAARRFTHDATLRGSTTALARTGIRVAAVDVTPADIAVTPYRVVRAFAPFLQPVHFGFRMERRVNPRVTWRDDAWTPHPLA